MAQTGKGGGGRGRKRDGYSIVRGEHPPLGGVIMFSMIRTRHHYWNVRHWKANVFLASALKRKICIFPRRLPTIGRKVPGRREEQICSRRI